MVGLAINICILQEIKNKFLINNARHGKPYFLHINMH
jgi:hypothetical protein